jgi:hypothetical protein
MTWLGVFTAARRMVWLRKQATVWRWSSLNFEKPQLREATSHWLNQAQEFLIFQLVEL